MEAMPNILSLSRNEHNENNNAGARILVSIYYMTSKYLNCHFMA